MALSDDQLAAIDPEHLPLGTEYEQLTGFLDYYRAVIERKCAGLGATQLATAVGSSDLTLGGMLKHLAFVEDWWFGQVLGGAEPNEPWASAPWHDDNDWDWHSARFDDPQTLVALYGEACQRSRAVLADRHDLDIVSARPNSRGTHFNLRWILIHMVEEYARHAGHADLLRQSIDGATGD